MPSLSFYKNTYKIVIVTGGASGIGEATVIELAKVKVDDLTELHPIGRLGVAMEVAKVVLFLASDDTSFISGVQLTENIHPCNTQFKHILYIVNKQ